MGKQDIYEEYAYLVEEDLEIFKVGAGFIPIQVIPSQWILSVSLYNPKLLIFLQRYESVSLIIAEDCIVRLS